MRASDWWAISTLWLGASGHVYYGAASAAIFLIVLLGELRGLK